MVLLYLFPVPRLLPSFLLGRLRDEVWLDSGCGPGLVLWVLYLLRLAPFWGQPSHRTWAGQGETGWLYLSVPKTLKVLSPPPLPPPTGCLAP